MADKIKTARSEHRCTASSWHAGCGRIILKGERYLSLSRGALSTFSVCDVCADISSDQPEEWALVRWSSGAEEYSPDQILLRGARFTYVQSALGEVRFTTRGLWDGMTREQADAQIEMMREARREICLRRSSAAA